MEDSHAQVMGKHVCLEVENAGGAAASGNGQAHLRALLNYEAQSAAPWTCKSRATSHQVTMKICFERERTGSAFV